MAKQLPGVPYLRESFGLSKERAEEVAAEVIRIHEEVGGGDALLAKYLFEAAQNEDSVLHGLFQWDVEVAFVGFNLGIARNIVRNVVAVYKIGRSRARERRVFASVVVENVPAGTPARAYRYVKEVAAQPDLLKQSERTAAQRVLRACEAVSDLGIESDVWKKIAELAQSI